jgi:Uma2 family endonuclease
MIALLTTSEAPMSLQQPTHWTGPEYLAFERSQNEKHEFIDGQIILQAGGSRRHAQIGVNIISSLHAQLRTKHCSVYGSDMRVAIPEARRYTYPDISAACEAPRFTDDHEDTLLNPVLIIEILSPSTERYDRGKKFQAYQMINTFSEYLLVAQDDILVEHFVRRSDSLWSFEVVTERSASIRLICIKCVLNLTDVYEKIDSGGV